jgi:DNA-binding NtrC family response regulator
MNVPRKKVVVADGNEEVLIALEKILEETGFDTTTVSTAREVLKLVDSRMLDLVLLNEYLPDAECEDLLKALRTRGERVPCIVMQPYAPEMADITRLQALGARRVVYKYGYQQIIEVMSECLACDQKAPLFA